MFGMLYTAIPDILDLYISSKYILLYSNLDCGISEIEYLSPPIKLSLDLVITTNLTSKFLVNRKASCTSPRVSNFILILSLLSHTSKNSFEIRSSLLKSDKHKKSSLIYSNFPLFSII
ncbi:hypothetical protein D3C81_1243830 [compost metagenome]